MNERSRTLLKKLGLAHSAQTTEVTVPVLGNWPQGNTYRCPHVAAGQLTSGEHGDGPNQLVSVNRHLLWPTAWSVCYSRSTARAPKGQLQQTLPFVTCPSHVLHSSHLEETPHGLNTETLL